MGAILCAPEAHNLEVVGRKRKSEFLTMKSERERGGKGEGGGRERERLEGRILHCPVAGIMKTVPFPYCVAVCLPSSFVLRCTHSSSVTPYPANVPAHLVVHMSSLVLQCILH